MATDAHGGFGGVSQYNRDVLQALSGLEGVGEVDVLPRIAQTPLGPTPPHVHYDLSGLGGRSRFMVATAKKALSNTYDLVYCAHINLLPAAVVAKNISRAPLALAIYGIDVWTDLGILSRVLAKANVNCLISISDITLQRFQAWASLPVEITHLVPNAICLEDYGAAPPDQSLRTKYGLDGKVAIMTMGRMVGEERQKGFDEMIAIFPSLLEDVPNAVLLFVGDGSDRNRLEQKAAKAGIGGRVIFTGRVSDGVKADIFRLADAYVMPSRGEGFGFVVLEAMASGVPVVTSSLDGTREAVLNGKLGAVVDPDNPQALRAEILNALAAPRKVPDGLSYFAFPEFQARLRSALNSVCSI